MNNKTEIFDLITNHLIKDTTPSTFLTELSKLPIFSIEPYVMLQKLQFTPQSPVHHPEGNVWNHTLLVVNEAAKRRTQSKNEKVFMWAALLHDIGKPATTATRKGKITSYNHDEVGAQLAMQFLHQFTDDDNFINEVAFLVKFHMQILFLLKNPRFASIEKMAQTCNAEEVALLGLCDRLGRKGANIAEEEKNIKTFIEKCKVYS
ncbi:MAG: HDIG domain-containing metalloprotein [Anaerotignaceae bacterium]